MGLVCALTPKRGDKPINWQLLRHQELHANAHYSSLQHLARVHFRPSAAGKVFSLFIHVSSRVEWSYFFSLNYTESPVHHHHPPQHPTTPSTYPHPHSPTHPHTSFNTCQLSPASDTQAANLTSLLLVWHLITGGSAFAVFSSRPRCYLTTHKPVTLGARGCLLGSDFPVRIMSVRLTGWTGNLTRERLSKLSSSFHYISGKASACMWQE